MKIEDNLHINSQNLKNMYATVFYFFSEIILV